MKRIICLTTVALLGLCIFCQAQSFSYNSYGILLDSYGVLDINEKLVIDKNSKGLFTIEVYFPDKSHPKYTLSNIRLRGHDEFNELYIYYANIKEMVTDDGFYEGKGLIQSKNKLDFFLKNNGNNKSDFLKKNDLSFLVYFEPTSCSNPDRILLPPPTTMRIYPYKE